MQLPLLHTYEMDSYDSVRLFLKEDSAVFKYISGLGTFHDVSGRIFIKGKFIRLMIEIGIKQTDFSQSQIYYFVETSDIGKLKDPYLLTLSEYSEIPKYVLKIDQKDIISIELLLDYSTK